jgi:hypothetical protein
MNGDLIFDAYSIMNVWIASLHTYMDTGDADAAADADAADAADAAGCAAIKSAIYCKFVGQLDFGIIARI